MWFGIIDENIRNFVFIFGKKLLIFFKIKLCVFFIWNCIKDFGIWSFRIYMIKIIMLIIGVEVLSFVGFS